MTSIVPITRGFSAFRRGAIKLQQKVSALVPAFLEQVFFFGGIASVSYGAWMIYKPLGPIIGGVSAVWISFLIAADRVAEEHRRRRPG
jgi:hypothetical protein